MKSEQEIQARLEDNRDEMSFVYNMGVRDTLEWVLEGDSDE